MYIYDEIGFSGVNADTFVRELADLDVTSIDVHINSPGGDYFAGVAISNAIRRHPASVTVHVDGLAASAASVIAMAGDQLIMEPGSQLMIHDALSLAIGNASDLRETADLLDKVSDDIAELYAAKAGNGGNAELWRGLMQAETWFNAEEAVIAGLANERVLPAKPAETVAPVAARWDLSIFKYEGREQAPEPALDAGRADPLPKQAEPPIEAEQPPVIHIDSEQLRSVIRKAIRG